MKQLYNVDEIARAIGYAVGFCGESMFLEERGSNS